jgi:hypothetical protein
MRIGNKQRSATEYTSLRQKWDKNNLRKLSAFIEIFSAKFSGNPSSGSRADTFGHTDRQTGRQTDRQTDRRAQRRQ